MLVKDLLDFARVDVAAAADDQVLLAVDDRVVAVGVDGGEVAGAEPAVGDRFRGGLRPFPVARHQDCRSTRAATTSAPPGSA
jgi:hypothetical protein